MIKKLAVDLLLPGMFIHDLDCAWSDHPFQVGHFMLKDRETIVRLAAHGIREVYIDTARGLDAAEGLSDLEIRRRVQQELREVAAGPRAAVTRSVPLHEELRQALRIREEAARVVGEAMIEARLGQPVACAAVAQVAERMVESVLRNRDALLSLGRARRMEQYTVEHSVNVAVLLVALAQELRLEPELIREVALGALLHDIGKVHVPDAILDKPGRLTEQELAMVRRHAVLGREALAGNPAISAVARAVVAEHHERHDGSGYPGALAGEAISRYGQMAAIADVYDAMTSDRSYHKGEPPTMVLGKLLEWSRFHFNPALVRQFIRCVGIYPVGILVRLESGRLAVVVAPDAQSQLQPAVRVVYDTRSRRPLPPHDLDLAAEAATGERIVRCEDPKVWNIDPLHYLSVDGSG